jgi:uncharacterized protein
MTEEQPYIPEQPQPRVIIVLLLQLAICLLLGILGSVLFLAIADAVGWDTTNLKQGLMAADASSTERWHTRIFLGINQFFTFTASALVVAWLCFRRLTQSGPGILDYFKLRPAPSLLHIGQGILLLVVAMPIVLFSYEINKLIPLSDNLSSMEKSTAEMLKGLLQMTNWGELTANIVVRQLQRLTKDPLLAILLASLIFSAIHMQFEGFLPRMLLGMVLGWLYWRTNSLWVPIAAHFFNNGIQVVAQYFYGQGLSTVDFEKDVEIPIGLVAASAVAVYFVMWWIRQKKEQAF